MTAVQLLHRFGAGSRSAEVVLCERSAGFTAGVAYGTRSEAHSLNVPAGRMSAYPDDRDHFLRWLRRKDPKAGGGSFIPRKLYATYLGDLLAEAEQSAGERATLQRVIGSVRDLDVGADAVTVCLEDGRRLAVDRAVLAIGNFPPGNPSTERPCFYQSPCYARDPWADSALDVDPDADVLLLGTGLTMLDIALALHERGHRGAIHAISRRGLLPQPHRVSIKPPTAHPRPAELDRWPRSVRGMLHALRGEARRAAGRGVDWREVLTALRADTPALWQGLSEPERRRFLRHLRPFWETHRHRAAPETAASIAEMIERGALHVSAGRVQRCLDRDDGVDVHWQPRGAAPAELRVGRVINCTGPDTDLRRVAEPLIQSLRSRGQLRPDALGLGLDSTPDGALVDASGVASERLFLVGPLRKGLLWENTAVPELRVEAAQLAERLARD